MRNGKRFKEKCVPLQVDSKDILYATELKYLCVHVCAEQLLKVSVEHLRPKFYRTFNRIYSRSKASKSQMISVELLKSYCFPFLFFAVDAMSLSLTHIRILENCTCHHLLLKITVLEIDLTIDSYLTAFPE